MTLNYIIYLACLDVDVIVIVLERLWYFFPGVMSRVGQKLSMNKTMFFFFFCFFNKDSVFLLENCILANQDSNLQCV